MRMTAREGVIKFALDFRPGPPPEAQLLLELEAWRTIFRRLGLVGCDPGRYQGLGFGNLSRRLPAGGPPDAFLISGTQTGTLEQLTPEHYVTVLDCSPEQNRVTACGPVPPSSEALSHAILYRADPQIHWVMHLHSPELFQAAQRLSLPTTAPDAAYGTPEMAEEIRRLASGLGHPALLIMGGHEDGVIAFGATAAEAGSLAVQTVAAALALPRQQ